MTNAYYTSPTDAAALTKVRASDLNNVDAATDAAFDKLPTETNLKQGKVTYAVDTGTANTYLVSLPHAPASYADGLQVIFKPTNTNTGASSINVNGLGVKSIKTLSGTDPVAGDITANGPTILIYNATTGYFYMASNSAASASAAATSATNAATSASNAATSASSAATSASNASTSASNAAASAATAASYTVPFSDANALIKGSADTTKQVRFEVDGLTTGTTRVVTVPDADLTLVGTATTQTLTNKTLTAPTFTGYTETVYELSGTVIDPANGTVQTKTLSGNTTFTESIADGQSVVLMLNPATYTTTWPTITWINATGSGAAPTLEASIMNVVVLWQVGGTLYGNWIGSA
jgi:hypothetical protein